MGKGMKIFVRIEFWIFKNSGVEILVYGETHMEDDDLMAPNMAQLIEIAGGDRSKVLLGYCIIFQ